MTARVPLGHRTLRPACRVSAPPTPWPPRSAVVAIGVLLLLGGCTVGTRGAGTGPPASDSAVPSTTTTTAPALAAPTTAAPAGGLVATGIGWSTAGLEGPMPAAASCRYRSAADGLTLPDSSCTPGAIDTSVTQSDLASTICHSGYTASVRPPESMTEAGKRRSMAAYSSPGSIGGYEYDHLVPLELGGSSDVRNLWPQPDQGSPSQFDSTDGFGINAKDGVENRLRAAVCSGQVALTAAQQAVAADWTTAEARLGISP